MTCGCPEMAANDVGQEGLVTPIALIGLRERATSLVTGVVIHKLELGITAGTESCVPVSAHVTLLTSKRGECLLYLFFCNLAPVKGDMQSAVTVKAFHAANDSLIRLAYG
jgi:hypothetical protein